MCDGASPLGDSRDICMALCSAGFRAECSRTIRNDLIHFRRPTIIPTGQHRQQQHNISSCLACAASCLRVLLLLFACQTCVWCSLIILYIYIYIVQNALCLAARHIYLSALYKIPWDTAVASQWLRAHHHMSRGQVLSALPLDVRNVRASMFLCCIIQVCSNNGATGHTCSLPKV